MTATEFEDAKNKFREFYNDNRESLLSAVTSQKALIQSVLLSKFESGAISSVDGRVKDREECLSKFTRKYRSELESNGATYSIRDKITDLIGIRVVCLYEDDVEKVKELISREFDVIDITDKIAQVEGTENSFGYKGLHLDLMLNKARKTMPEYQHFAEFPFELQIRTVVQDSWSIVDHKIKYKKSIPNSLKRRINTLAALFELADREFRAIRDETAETLARTESIYESIDKETVNSDFETAGKNKNQKQTPGSYTPLNAFYFLRIAQHFFPEFEFEAHKVDGFTQFIISMEENITRGKFNFYMRQNISMVKQYQSDCENLGMTMNPYTIIRHCLYAGNRKNFKEALTKAARYNFDTWQKKLNS